MIVESYEDVILLSGALRSNFWDTIQTAISLTLKRHPTGVIIDCSGITEATPEGAETFRDAMSYIEGHDARIIVAAVPQPIREVLKSVPEVRSQLPIADSVEEARRSLDLLLEPEGKKVKAPREKLVKIVMLLTSGDSCSEIYELADEMSQVLHAEIVVAYVVLVPRHLPIQAPNADEEEKAIQTLEIAKKELGKRHVPHSVTLERGRDVATALQNVLEETHAVRVLAAIPPDESELDDQLKSLRSVLTKVTLPVFVVRPQLDRK